MSELPLTEQARIRRILALGALVVTGLASLATSQSYSVEDQVDGRLSMGPDGAAIHVLVRLNGVRGVSSTYEPAASGLTFQVRGDGNSAAAGSVQAQIVGPGQDGAAVPWSATPTTVSLPLESCPSECLLDYSINLR